MLTSRQLFGVKTPPAPPSLHERMPIIELDGFVASETEAVTVILLSEVNEVVFALTEVTVESGKPEPWPLVVFDEVVEICDIAKLEA